VITCKIEETSVKCILKCFQCLQFLYVYVDLWGMVRSAVDIGKLAVFLYSDFI
jgi:hypothetical protein